MQQMERQRIEMAAILGVDEPVPETVLRAAVADPTYAHNLLVCRGDREYLDYLLAHPPSVHDGSDAIGAGTLVRRAAESLVRWARTGFSTVPEAQYQERLAACTACPHLRAPPASQVALYTLAGAARDAHSVCGKCGCVTAVKARRTSESCPDAHPHQFGLSRWGEKFPPAE